MNSAWSLWTVLDRTSRLLAIRAYHSTDNLLAEDRMKANGTDF